MIRQWPLQRLHVYVFFSFAIFLTVEGLKFYSIPAPSWIFHHLNDFLLIPMVATLGLHCVWWLKKNRTLRLNVFTILSLVALFSIIFEYYLPRQNFRYTADFWDVVCYALGGMVFYILQEME